MSITVGRDVSQARTRIGERRTQAQDHHGIANLIFEPRLHGQRSWGDCELVNLCVSSRDAVALDQITESKLTEVANRGDATARQSEAARAGANSPGLWRHTLARDGQIIRTRQDIAGAWRRQHEEILLAEFLHFASGGTGSRKSRRSQYVWQCVLGRDEQS